MPHRSRHRSDRRRAWLATFAAIVVAGCRSSIPASDIPSATAWPEVTAASIDAASSAVSFKTVDGAVLGGRTFGQGPTAMVLSHMGDAENNQSDWYAFALQLSRRGFLALTFDRRGVCPGGIGGCSTAG